MEERKLNLDAPFLSVRRISTKPDYSSDSGKEKSKSIIDSCPYRESQTPVCLPDQSFDHLTEPASIPFVWEQTPGRPKNMTTDKEEDEPVEKTGLVTEPEQDDDGDVYSDGYSSNCYLSVNCSSSGVSSEFEKNVEKSDEIPEYLDVMMSRFLPAAKAMTLKQQKQDKNRESSVLVQRKQPLVTRKHEALYIPSHSENLNTDEHDESDDEDHDDDDEDEVEDDKGYVYSNMSKKVWGFLPRLCIKNSLSVLNPVSSLRVKTCKDLGKPGKIIHPKKGIMGKQNLKKGFSFSTESSPRSNRVMNDSGDLHHPMTPSWSSRRLSGFISPYRYGSTRSSLSESGFVGTPEKAEIFRANRLYRTISKSQELYPRNTREIMGFSHSPVSKSGEIRVIRNSIPRTPSRLQRQGSPVTRSQRIHDVEFLAEEVKRRRNMRSGNLLEQQCALVAVSPPPLPKTPSESWLGRTLTTPRSSTSCPYVSSRADSMKLPQETAVSAKWETIVKTSYVHHDHVRYSEELIVHPSRLHKTYH